MAKRRFRRLAALVKIEATYGTDAVPTGAADAVQFNDVSFTPLAGSEERRDLLLPYLGHQGVLLTGDYVQLEGSVEIAGSGALGTAPGYGPLLRACGFAETVTALTSVEYDPVSGGQEAVSIYYLQDGVRHVMLGVRGTVTLSLNAQQIPRLRFTLQGLVGTITDVALPTVDLGAFVKPVVVSVANTTLSLFGWQSIAASLLIDLGNQVAPYLMIGAESIEIGDRQTTGTAVVEATSLATIDWFAIARARTRGALVAVHGTVAGNIVQIDAPALEIGRPTQGEAQGILNYSLPLMATPVAGDDELKLTIR